MLPFCVVMIEVLIVVFASGYVLGATGPRWFGLVKLAWRYRRERNLARRRMARIHYQAVRTAQELNEQHLINNVLVRRCDGQGKWIGKQMLDNAVRSKVPDHLPEGM